MVLGPAIVEGRHRPFKHVHHMSIDSGILDCSGHIGDLGTLPAIKG